MEKKTKYRAFPAQKSQRKIHGKLQFNSHYNTPVALNINFLIKYFS